MTSSPPDPPQPAEPLTAAGDHQKPLRRRRRLPFVVSALLFELGLGGLALLLASLLGYDLHLKQSPQSVTTARAVGLGVLAALPLLAGLVWLQRRPPKRLQSFVDYCDRHLVPIFRPLSVAELGLLSVAAGIGEELLFRGFIMGTVSHWSDATLGAILGLTVSSLLFGVCHWLTMTYAVLATAVGFYFGLLLLVSDHLLVPIVAHASYDFLALLCLTKKMR